MRALAGDPRGRARRAARRDRLPLRDVDPAIAHLTGACGYTFGVTTEPRHGELIDPLLLMPRVEVAGGDTLEDFARKLAG